MGHYSVFKEISLQECDLAMLPGIWAALRPSAKCSVSIMHNTRMNTKSFPNVMLI